MTFLFSQRPLRRILHAIGLTAAASVASAQSGTESVPELDPVFVEGRAGDLIGRALTSSQGTVGHPELAQRPFLRRGELLEVIPGIVITQHSGGGKANQYFLRGFNLDHGTDFSVALEGMPVNLRAHAHGQGYADLNFLMPEFVQGVDYAKGPFLAAVGDFSGAGAAHYRLFTELPADFIRFEVGEDSHKRVVAGTTLRSQGQATVLGFEAEYYDGPWIMEDDFRRFNGLVRHTWRRGDNELTLTGLGYRSTWNATDQIPRRAVDAGLLDRLGFVDPSNGGESDRASLSLDWSRKESDTTTRLNAYAIHYRLNLFSNFTYFLEDPVNGDQFNQRDRRVVAGGSVEQTWSGEPGALLAATTVGAQVQADFISELGLHHTGSRIRLETIREDDVTTVSAGLHVGTALRLAESVRAEVGLRGDLFAFDVESDNPLNSGDRQAGIVSPKLGLVFSPAERTEFYLNAGHGFHSNDARGAVIRVDPVSGDPADRADPLVRSLGFEAGVRLSPITGLVTTISWWHLDLDSELVFVGDGGGTEPGDASRRQGVEIANFYRIGSWLTLDADLALTRGRYRNAAAQDRIANSVGRVVTAGATVDLGNGWFGALRLRYFGSQPLIEDNSVRAPSSLTLNARAGFTLSDWEFSVAVLNLLNRRNNDIAYYYTSRLPGESAEGVDDVHFHPAEPRSFRFMLTRRF